MEHFHAVGSCFLTWVVGEFEGCLIEEIFVRDQSGSERIGCEDVEAFGNFLVDDLKGIVWFFSKDQLKHVLVVFLGGCAVPAERVGGGGTDFGMFLFIAKNGADEIDLRECPFGRASVSEEADGAAFFDVVRDTKAFVVYFDRN